MNNEMKIFENKGLWTWLEENIKQVSNEYR